MDALERREHSIQTQLNINKLYLKITSVPANGFSEFTFCLCVFIVINKEAPSSRIYVLPC